MKPANSKTKDMTLISLFAVVMAACSWVSIPTAIPFTMQTFGVFLTVGVLGGRRGTLAIVVYLFLGAIGMPVYAGGTAGPGIILGSTGGYMLAWVFSGLITWAMETLLGRKTWVLALSMLLGLIACYALGTIWFVAFYAREVGRIGVLTALSWCVIPFVIPDLLKMALSLVVRKRLAPFMEQNPPSNRSKDPESVAMHPVPTAPPTPTHSTTPARPQHKSIGIPKHREGETCTTGKNIDTK